MDAGCICVCLTVPLGVSTISVRNVLSVTIARASVVSSATNPQEGYLTQLWVSVCVCVCTWVCKL